MTPAREESTLSMGDELVYVARLYVALFVVEDDEIVIEFLALLDEELAKTAKHRLPSLQFALVFYGHGLETGS